MNEKTPEEPSKQISEDKETSQWKDPIKLGQEVIDSILSRVRVNITETLDMTYVSQLIRRMNTHTDISWLGISSSETVSWRAYREAEALDKERLIPALVHYLEQARKSNERPAAYFVLGQVIKNTEDIEATQYIVNLVNTENHRYVYFSLLGNLQRIKKPKGINLDPIFQAILTNKFGYAYAAIRALKGSQSEAAEDFLIAIICEPSNREALIEANGVLSSVGTIKSIEYLERHTKTRWNIGRSARYAIEAIKKRIWTMEEGNND